jgi:SAM-dependent methyltransferase
MYFDEIFKTLGERKTNHWKLKIFERYACIDEEQRKEQYKDFSVKREQIMKNLNSPAKVLEIGFGTGEHLYSLLQRGVNAYGIDSSITAANNFQNKYPQFANRVRCGSRFDELVDVIYCCALFEHLDQPEHFIQDATHCLSQDGLLIIDGLPILNEGTSDLTVDEDINFWKPCHRAIYSSNGLKALFARYGFVDKICTTHDDYYYRILSLHIRYGYRIIVELRSFYMEHKKLPSIPIYYYICRKALRINSLAHYGCIMFKKGRN